MLVADARLRNEIGKFGLRPPREENREILFRHTRLVYQDFFKFISHATIAQFTFPFHIYNIYGVLACRAFFQHQILTY